MISVVILTMNEAANLPRCLDSIRWCDDVLVLDSGSTDATVALATSSGARVMNRRFDSFAGQRNYAMEQGELRHPWVLHLDADEVVRPELARELQAIAGAASSPFPVYRIPSRIILRGRWLRRAGMYPAYQVRFGRREALRFVDHGHGQREVQPPDQVGTIAAAFDHYNFSKGVNDWFARHLRYAREEARQSWLERGESLRVSGLWSGDSTERRRALKRIAHRLPCRPSLRFFYSYFLRGGVLDGKAGLQYARMLATYQRFIDMNLAELREAQRKGES
ncbi:glycosyltransferase family 2 protein [Arenimonas sp.]|uniref:glycosyltransferase family 2 protein n=1 Tax=Arenimonas sp. TaxID=1872635 RepID=UPI0039E5B31F